jgi:hypothetical protein
MIVFKGLVDSRLFRDKGGKTVAYSPVATETLWPASA